MGFVEQETSRSLGAPIGLLLFTYGDGEGDVYGYTDCEQAVTYNDITFAPVPTDHDSITSSGTLDKATIDVSVPQDSDIARFFDIWPPSRVVTLSIMEGHVGASDFKVRWTGRVVAHKVEGNAAVFTCEPISTSLRRSGLRRKYQLGCPHVLYGDQCRANKAAATSTFTVQTVDGATVTLPNDWASDDLRPKYLNGLATWTGSDGRLEIRSILRILNATDVLLTGIATNLEGGAAISLAFGCSHQMGDCSDLHDNILNFGGQPWIPTRNPIGVVNNF